MKLFENSVLRIGNEYILKTLDNSKKKLLTYNGDSSVFYYKFEKQFFISSIRYITILLPCKSK